MEHRELARHHRVAMGVGDQVIELKSPLFFLRLGWWWWSRELTGQSAEAGKLVEREDL